MFDYNARGKNWETASDATIKQSAVVTRKGNYWIFFSFTVRTQTQNAKSVIDFEAVLWPPNLFTQWPIASPPSFKAKLLADDCIVSPERIRAYSFIRTNGKNRKVDPSKGHSRRCEQQQES